MKKRLVSIHYCRGIAALMVCLGHLAIVLGDQPIEQFLKQHIFWKGNFRVELFFLISGLVTMYATRKNVARDWSLFIGKRLLRLYPLFFLAVTSYFIVSPDYSIFSKQFIKSLMFIHSDYKGTAPYFQWQPLYPTWTMAYEVLFVLIFGISMLVSSKYRGHIVCATILALCLILQLSTTGQFSLNAAASASFGDNKTIHAPLMIASSPIMSFFVAGIVIYWVIESIEARMIFFKTASILLGALFLFQFIAAWPCQQQGWTGVGIWAVTFLLTCISMEKAGWMPKLRLLDFLGRISYPLFLFHVVVLTIFDRVFTHGNDTTALYRAFTYMTTLLAAIGMAWVIHHAVEVRLTVLASRMGRNIKYDTRQHSGTLQPFNRSCEV